MQLDISSRMEHKPNIWEEGPFRHFIIKGDGVSIDGYTKPCAGCGASLHVSESRYDLLLLISPPSHSPLLLLSHSFITVIKFDKMEFERELISMDVEVDERGGDVSTTAASALVILQGGSRRSKAIHQFTQQTLPACKPVLTPAWVIGTFFFMGVIFIPVGLISLHASQSVHEIVDRYDTECIPDAFKSNKVAYIKNASTPKSCQRYLKVHKPMKAPIYIYYQLDNYYQNHRRYVKSRSDEQLLRGLGYNKTGSCEPLALENGLPIVPCGLVAWSLFNDTYSFSRGSKKLEIERKNIAWKSDQDHKFGKQVYPFNFQNSSFVGGGKLDTTIPLSDQEDLIVWMRTAAFPSFRKLYGRIEEDLDEDDIIVVHLMNNYNTYSFGGKKMLVLSTSSWLGGKNGFLGVAYIFVGSSSILIALIFLLLHVKNPRPYGDTMYLSGNRKDISR